MGQAQAVEVIAIVRTMRMAELVALVTQHLGVSEDDLRGEGRDGHLQEARAILYYLARRYTRMRWRAIGRYSTKRTADTVRRSEEAMAERLERKSEKDLRLLVEALKRDIEGMG